MSGKSNYLLGNDPAEWHTNVANYAKVQYRDVYPGVDLVYYGNQGRLEYDYVVAPGADPDAIRLAIEHRSTIRIDGTGNLLVGSDGGEVMFHKPVVYQPATGQSQAKIQNPKMLEGKFVIEAEREIAFEVTAYDRGKPLIIDPVLSCSTFLGGSNDEDILAIAVDDSGNAYVTGWTDSADFPTINPLQSTEPGFVDVFVAKLNPTGSALVYSTYLGGASDESSGGIAVNKDGNAVVTGTTFSATFPPPMT